jgi:DNA-binding XRE family transcriptional regulator
MMQNPFSGKYTLEEVTGAILQVLEENKTGVLYADELVANMTTLGVVNKAWDRLNRKAKSFPIISGRELRLRRLSLNLSAEQLGNYCGVNQETIGSLERGTTKALSYESMWLLWHLLYRCDGVPSKEDKKYLNKRRRLKLNDNSNRVNLGKKSVIED